MKEFTITEDHLKLLRRANVGWDSGEYGAPAMDCKRPFGNSDVPMDIADILGWEYDPEFGPNQALRELCYAIHRELGTVLQIGLITGQFLAGRYIQRIPYTYTSWERA